MDGSHHTAKLRLFLVDDHAILREGIRALIGAQADMEVVGEAPDGDGIEQAVHDTQPDVVVMDISMPTVPGTEATRRIRTQFPKARVLVLTAHEESVYVQHLLNAGASGYLLKRAAASDLVRAIRAVAAGQLYLDTTTATHVRQTTPAPAAPFERAAPSDETHAELSEREADVLRYVALGYSMKRMAATLGLSTRTLETYKHRGMTKLELANRADVVRLALQRGWING